MNFFNMLELDQSSTLKKILSIMKLTVVFLIAFSLQRLYLYVFLLHDNLYYLNATMHP